MNDTTNTQTKLNFRVRNGLNVHLARVVSGERLGRKFTEVQRSVYGQASGVHLVSLDPDEVKNFAHALEPTDDASAAALEAMHFKAPPARHEVIYAHRIATETSTAVVQALISGGFLKIPTTEELVASGHLQKAENGEATLPGDSGTAPAAVTEAEANFGVVEVRQKSTKAK